MSDLIDRNKAIEAIHADLMGGLNYESILKEMPTVDAEPVRHGKWIEEDDYEYGENTWRCSVCGEPYVLIEGTPKQNLYNYCPNCGAKMDERKEE